MNSEPKITKRRCPTCGGEMEIQVGIGNFKNLFKKPTFSEVIVFVCMVMVLLAAWAYQHDTKVCREYVNNFAEICTQYNYNPNEATSGRLNYSNFTFNLTLPSQVKVYKNVSMYLIDENG